MSTKAARPKATPNVSAVTATSLIRCWPDQPMCQSAYKPSPSETMKVICACPASVARHKSTPAPTAHPHARRVRARCSAAKAAGSQADTAFKFRLPTCVTNTSENMKATAENKGGRTKEEEGELRELRGPRETGERSTRMKPYMLAP